MNTAVSLPNKNDDEVTKMAMGYRWYAFESISEGSRLDVIQLSEEEFAVIQKFFKEREALVNEPYSGSYNMFGSTNGYETKLDVLRAYAKENYVDPVDITDEDMAVIIGREQDEGLFDDEDEEEEEE